MLCSTNSHYVSSRWPGASIGQKLCTFSLIGASWSSLGRKGARCRCCIFTVADYYECYICASSNALEWRGCFALRYAAFRKCPHHSLSFWKVKELLYLHWWLEETEVVCQLLSTPQITEFLDKDPLAPACFLQQLSPGIMQKPFVTRCFLNQCIYESRKSEDLQKWC